MHTLHTNKNRNNVPDGQRRIENAFWFQLNSRRLRLVVDFVYSYDSTSIDFCSSDQAVRNRYLGNSTVN